MEPNENGSTRGTFYFKASRPSKSFVSEYLWALRHI